MFCSWHIVTSERFKDWLSNRLDLVKTKSSRQLFLWFWKSCWGTKSWLETNNTVKYGYVCQDNSSLFYSYVFGLYLVSPVVHKGRKRNNTMCLRMAGEVLSISLSIFTDKFIWIMFCFVNAITRPAFPWNMGNYGSRSNIYFLQLLIWLICFHW